MASATHLAARARSAMRGLGGRAPSALDATLMALSLAAAYAIKHHYSGASAEDLTWILRPTASLVEFITSASFRFERGLGFVDRAHAFAIVPACAGINFSIVAYLSGVFGLLGRGQAADQKVALVVGTALAAFFATLAANAIRIAIAFWLRGAELSALGLSGEELHRIHGSAVYVGCLLALFWAARTFVGRGDHVPRDP